MPCAADGEGVGLRLTDLVGKMPRSVVDIWSLSHCVSLHGRLLR